MAGRGEAILALFVRVVGRMPTTRKGARALATKAIAKAFGLYVPPGVGPSLSPL